MTEFDFTMRRQRLGEALGAKGFDAVAMVPGANFFYLTGIKFHLMERPTILFIDNEATVTAVMPSLERGKWQSTGPGGETHYWRDSDGYDRAMADAVAALPGKRIGVEGLRMRMFEAEALRHHVGNGSVEDAQELISAMRLIKDDAEINLLREAIRISEAALETTLKVVERGISEVEICQTLVSAMLDQGADGVAFAPLVLSGAAAADPHGTSSRERRLQPGDPLLIDFGATYAGYNADITRTVYLEHVSVEFTAIHETVLGANARGREMVTSATTAHDVDVAVTKVLRNSPFGEFIVHKTGHGLGMDVHEAPQIMVGNHTELVPGMVFTIEPGLYLPGRIGIRIEDDFLVTEDGGVSLTSAERGPRIVGL